MSGHGKSMVEYDWMVAANLISEGCVEYNTLEPVWEDDKTNFVLPSETRNIDDILSVKQLTDKLSLEAKKMIDLILDSDEKTIERLTTKKYNCISKELIREYYKGMGYRNNIINKIFNELKQFVTECEI